MSQRAVCPECGTNAAVLPGVAKSTIKCEKCGTSFPNPAARPSSGPPPLPPRKSASAEPEGFEVLDDEETDFDPRTGEHESDADWELVEDEDEPAARPAQRGGRDEDDEDDDEPRSRSRRASTFDDEDEDAPPPRKKNMVGLILAFMLGFLLLAGGGGFFLFKYLFDAEPVQVVRNPDVDDPIPNDPGPRVPTPKPGDPKPKPPDPKVPAKVDPIGIPITPVAMKEDRKTIRLPGPAADIVAGADGRYLFLHIPTERKLLAYDASAGNVVKEFETSGPESQIAAGRSYLLIGDNARRQLRRINLATLEQDREQMYPFLGTLADLSMGSGSDDPALAVISDPYEFRFLDVESLSSANVGWKELPAADLPRAGQFRAAANGSLWVGLPLNGIKGALVIGREGNRVAADWLYREQELGYAVPSNDGKVLFSRLGTAPVGEPLPLPKARDSAAFLIPTVAGRLHCTVVRVKAADGEEARAVVGETASTSSRARTRVPIPEPYQPGSSIPPDQCLFPLLDAHSLVVCPARDRASLEIVPVKQEVALAGDTVRLTSTPPTMFRPGSRWVFQTRAIAMGDSRTYELKGPTGMSVNAAGTVEWNVPAGETQEKYAISVSLSSSGMRVTQTFDIHNANAPLPKPVPPKSKEPMPKTPDPKVPTSPIAPGVKLVMESPGKLPISPPEMKEPRVEIPLPGPMADACIGGGGRYLIVHCPGVRKLLILDVNTLKIVKEITLGPGEVLFAAGMNKLMVVYPNGKDVHRFSLEEGFKFEADEVLNVLQKPTVAAMGSGTAGPLILGGIPAQNNASKMALAFIDPATMKEVEIQKAEGDFRVTFAAPARLRVSADGRTLGAWYSQLKPTRLQIAQLADNTIRGTALEESVGIVAPSADGQTIFTEKGAFDLQARPVGPRVACIPAVQGVGHVRVEGSPNEAQTVSVFGADPDQPIASYTVLPGFDGKRDPFERGNPNLQLDRRLFYVPDAKIVIAVPPTANRLIVQRVEPAGK